MSAYGGYTKSGFGGNEGGFFAGSQQGSQGGEGGGPRSKTESLRPVTIKQIYDAEEPYGNGEFKIDNAPASQVTIVGQVRRVTPQSTVVNYRIGDSTGEIDVSKWISTDSMEEAPPTFELDSYVRVTGLIKSANNKRSIFSNAIRPVTDYNQVNYHMLESTYVHLYYTRGPLGAQNGAAGGGGADGGSMFVDGGADHGSGAGGQQNASKVANSGPNAKRVFNFINSTPGGNEGIHLNVIMRGTGMALRDVLEATDELLGSGIIYTTNDDETWAILEY